MRYFKSTETDGKWRLAFFDLDCSFYMPYCGMAVIFDQVGNHPITDMTYSLQENKNFRDMFKKGFQY